MSFKEWLRAKLTIRMIAQKEGVSSATIRASMQEVIDEAWATADPAIMAQQLRRFPTGKPTVEEFMAKLAQELKTNFAH